MAQDLLDPGIMLPQFPNLQKSISNEALGTDGFCEPAHKIVPKHHFVHPFGLILPLELLLEFEMESVSRGLLSLPKHTNGHPLRFIAETERNLYLWRKGYSIAETDKFSFWIDLPRLIQKRLKALANLNFSNAISDQSWNVLEPAIITEDLQEKAYLEEFLSLFNSYSVKETQALLVTSCECKSPDIVLPEK